MLSLLAALALAAPASADSIVYTKGADVWVAEPDGSGERQVSRDGSAALPYQSPSQADDGTIVAQRGTRFVRLDRNGAVLATLNSVLTDKPAGISAVGPFDPQVSPDGTLKPRAKPRGLQRHARGNAGRPAQTTRRPALTAK